MIKNIHKEELILQNLKGLKVSNNKYYWWRKYEYPKIQINRSTTLLEKIKMGYYSFPLYFWEAQQSLLILNNLYKPNINQEVWLEISYRERIRYKKLLENFYKDENEILNQLYNDFTKEFTLDKIQVVEEIEKFDGTILELYNHFLQNFKYKIYPSWKRTF